MPIRVNPHLKNADVRKGDPEGQNFLVGKNEKMKFPDSMQGYRPKYSVKRTRAWDTKLSEKEIKTLLEDLSFTYESGPREGELITGISLRNEEDLFMNHSRFYLPLDEGHAILDDELTFDRLMLGFIKADPEVDHDEENSNPAFAANKKWKLILLDNADKAESDEIDLSVEATVVFSKLDFERKVAICRAMGRPVSSRSPDAANKMLHTLITRDKNLTAPSGRTNIKEFMELAKGSAGKLIVTDIVNRAKAKGVITRTSNKYFYGDIELGPSLEKVQNFLSEEDNKDILEKIKTYSEKD